MAYYNKYQRRYDSFEDLVENGLSGRMRRKVSRNTYLEGDSGAPSSIIEAAQRRDSPDDYDDDNVASVKLVYHGTAIAVCDPDGITLDPHRTGDQLSQSDQRRLNTFFPINLFRHEGRAYLWDWQTVRLIHKNVGKTVMPTYMPLMYGGIKVDWNGEIISAVYQTLPLPTDEFVAQRKADRQKLKKYLNWWEYMTRNGAPLDAVWHGKDVYLSGTSNPDLDNSPFTVYPAGATLPGAYTEIVSRSDYRRMLNEWWHIPSAIPTLRVAIRNHSGNTLQLPLNDALQFTQTGPTTFNEFEAARAVLREDFLVELQAQDRENGRFLRDSE